MESSFHLNSCLSKEDWNLLGYNDWPGRQQTSLSRNTSILSHHNNDIFRHANFLGTTEEYVLIQPAIRLASALLATPASIRFIVPLVWEQKRLPRQFDFNDKPTFQFRRSKETDVGALMDRFLTIFGQLATNTSYGPAPPGCREDFEDFDLHGKCTIKDAPEGSNFHRGPDLKGTKRHGHQTMIWFNHLTMERIAELDKAGKSHCVEMQALQFSLAVTLCHEAIHAIHTASDWKAYLRMMMHFKHHRQYEYELEANEPYFEDYFVAELGFSWEMEVFGVRIFVGLSLFFW